MFCSAEATWPHAVLGIEKRCRQAGTTLPSVILLAIVRALGHIVGASHPKFGLFQSGQVVDYPEIGSAAGPTVNLVPLVITDALKTPVMEALQTIRRDLNERTLHDQTHLQDIRSAMKGQHNELLFNLQVNLVLATPKLSDGATRNVHSFLIPLCVPSESSPISKDTSAGVTAVHSWDWDWLPCQRNVYLEVGYDQTGKLLCWRLDCTSSRLKLDEVQDMLRTIKEEFGGIIGKQRP